MWRMIKYPFSIIGMLIGIVWAMTGTSPTIIHVGFQFIVPMIIGSVIDEIMHKSLKDK